MQTPNADMLHHAQDEGPDALSPQELAEVETVGADEEVRVVRLTAVTMHAQRGRALARHRPHTAEACARRGGVHAASTSHMRTADLVLLHALEHMPAAQLPLAQEMVRRMEGGSERGRTNVAETRRIVAKVLKAEVRLCAPASSHFVLAAPAKQQQYCLRTSSLC